MNKCTLAFQEVIDYRISCMLTCSREDIIRGLGSFRNACLDSALCACKHYHCWVTDILLTQDNSVCSKTKRFWSNITVTWNKGLHFVRDFWMEDIILEFQSRVQSMQYCNANVIAFATKPQWSYTKAVLKLLSAPSDSTVSETLKDLLEVGFFSAFHRDLFIFKRDYADRVDISVTLHWLFLHTRGALSLNASGSLL